MHSNGGTHGVDRTFTIPIRHLRSIFSVLDFVLIIIIQRVLVKQSIRTCSFVGPRHAARSFYLITSGGSSPSFILTPFAPFLPVVYYPNDPSKLARLS